MAKAQRESLRPNSPSKPRLPPSIPSADPASRAGRAAENENEVSALLAEKDMKALRGIDSVAHDGARAEHRDAPGSRAAIVRDQRSRAGIEGESAHGPEAGHGRGQTPRFRQDDRFGPERPRSRTLTSRPSSR